MDLEYYEKTVERFWSKVARSDDEDGCWLWEGRFDASGYGSFDIGNTIGAHVFSYILEYGPVPRGKMVLHTCHNRPCVQPKHLYAGDHEDNARDMIEAGRQSTYGKLNLEIAREIRRRYGPLNGRNQWWRRAHGLPTKQELMREYGVAKGTIDAILYETAWKEPPQ